MLFIQINFHIIEEKKNKNKTPVKYICPKCSKDFGNHKYHYEIHLNKKKSCVKIEKANDLEQCVF